MMDPATFRAIVSGQRRDLAARAARGALCVAEWPYRWAVGWRNRRYDRDPTTVHRAGVPVISVGNLTLGGTGKTPMVEYLARWLLGRGQRVVLISRGYGSRSGAANDEALELAQKLPEVPHLQNPDRVAAAAEAIARHRAEAILLDDAFQHRRIARDLDLVMLDALEPFGFDHVFPRGTLREPPEGLRRADAVVLSRADLIEPHQRERLWQRVACYAPDAPQIEAAHAPVDLLAPDGSVEALDAMHDRPVAAFCGIGNPEGFRRTLQRIGCRLLGRRTFPDHHRYTAEEAAELHDWARRLGAEALLCTQKDLVKFTAAPPLDCPLRAVRIAMQLTHGEEQLIERLTRLWPTKHIG